MIRYQENREIPIATDTMPLARKLVKATVPNEQSWSLSLADNECLVCCIHEGSSLVWAHEVCLTIDAKMILIVQQETTIEFRMNSAYFEYAILCGENVKDAFSRNVILLDPSFYRKGDYFFRCLDQSLNKYSCLDAYAMASSVYRFFSDATHSNSESDSQKAKIVDRIMAYVEKHYDTTISLDAISEEIGYSKYYLSHVFKEIMSLTIHEYVIRRRLTQVKHYLLEDVLSVEEIAQRCGFSSDVALYKTFKNVYAVTPGQFKKLNRIKTDENESR